MNSDTHTTPTLSPLAQARKVAALPALRQQVRRRGMRRRAARTGLAMAGLALVAGVAWIGLAARSGSPHAGPTTDGTSIADARPAQLPVLPGTSHPLDASDAPHARGGNFSNQALAAPTTISAAYIVSTGDLSVAGYIIPTVADESLSAQISDAQLGAFLAEAGQPAGIVRVGGRAYAEADIDEARARSGAIPNG
jgi:hypothetical protein